jgi:hypothetical protein
MATQYKVNISMPVGTVDALNKGNYQLYGFKAVATTMGGGAPLVWFATSSFSTSTAVQWTTQYQGYTSLSEIVNGVTINASFSANMDLKQTLNVTGKTGTGSVVTGGVDSALSINNQTVNPFTCGISEQQGSNPPTPLCAFPLYGGGLDVIAPIEKVLLTFATKQVNTGTVIEKAYAPGYLIDLTGAPGNTRAVGFDINLGWSNDGGVWAQQVAANANLLPLLIDSSPSTVQALLKVA